MVGMNKNWHCQSFIGLVCLLGAMAPLQAGAQSNSEINPNETNSRSEQQLQNKVLLENSDALTKNVRKYQLEIQKLKNSQRLLEAEVRKEHERLRSESLKVTSDIESMRSEIDAKRRDAIALEAQVRSSEQLLRQYTPTIDRLNRTLSIVDSPFFIFLPFLIFGGVFGVIAFLFSKQRKNQNELLERLAQLMAENSHNQKSRNSSSDKIEQIATRLDRVVQSLKNDRALAAVPPPVDPISRPLQRAAATSMGSVFHSDTRGPLQMGVENNASQTHSNPLDNHLLSDLISSSPTEFSKVMQLFSPTEIAVLIAGCDDLLGKEILFRLSDSYKEGVQSELSRLIQNPARLNKLAWKRDHVLSELAVRKNELIDQASASV